MTRLENGSYDEVVAHLERELELNSLEESDDLHMATITSSSSKPKTPLFIGQMSDITCNYCKEKGHMVNDCGKLKRKKEKDAQQGKPTQKKTYPKCPTCVDRVPVRTLNPSASDQRTRRTMIQTPSPQNPTTSQHHPTPNLHQTKMIQKTSFATAL